MPPTQTQVDTLNALIVRYNGLVAAQDRNAGAGASSVNAPDFGGTSLRSPLDDEKYRLSLLGRIKAYHRRLVGMGHVLGGTIEFSKDGTLPELPATAPETPITPGDGSTPEIPISPTHTQVRYAALMAAGSAPGDFTEAVFLAGNTSMTRDIFPPMSAADMVVGLAVPSYQGVVSEIIGLDEQGNVNQFALHLRANFLPAVGAAQVTLDIDGEEHYVYATNGTVRSILLGHTGYRLTQTA